MRRGQKHSPEACARIGAAAKARGLGNRQGREQCLKMNAAKRIVFTPEMTEALIKFRKEGMIRFEMASKIGVCQDIITRELRALTNQGIISSRNKSSTGAKTL